jgi:hypothetical protein
VSQISQCAIFLCDLTSVSFARLHICFDSAYLIPCMMVQTLMLRAVVLNPGSAMISFMTNHFLDFLGFEAVYRPVSTLFFTSFSFIDGIYCSPAVFEEVAAWYFFCRFVICPVYI